MTGQVAGRSCPVNYAYGPDVFKRPPELVTSTVYVIGGLYGNPFALDASEALASHETDTPQLVFNGDFHWFDLAPDVYADIQQRVMQHAVVRGNVESELAADDDDVGCGCGYPDEVSDDEVARSNQIISMLRATAS